MTCPTSRQRREKVDSSHETLSISSQCKILDISRSGYYYKAVEESELNLELMRLMDEHYLDYPFKGARGMHIWLRKDMGYQVSRNRVDRLYYKVMGLRSVLPGPHTSKRNPEHKVYPYLLRELNIERPNQVWATDITYIPMPKGYMYLVAIIDLYSRFVVGWSLSNSMDAQWCKECLEEAIEVHGKPEIFNTDQGSQFTSEIFSQFVLEQGIRLSMDGKGRATDNAFIERLWRSVKYEHVYLKPQEDGTNLYQGLLEYFEFYNFKRRHQSIEEQTPATWFEHHKNLPLNKAI